MALVQFGSNVTGLKGSVGGQVFQGGFRGTILRNKNLKVQPKSDQYYTNKSIFAYLTSAWKNLDSATKDLWNQYASTFPATDAFGNPISISGYNYFMAVNLFINTGEIDHIVSPMAWVLPPFNMLNSYGTDIPNSIINVNTSTWIGPYYRIKVFVSDRLDIQSNSVPTKFRFCSNIYMQEGVPTNIYSYIQATQQFDFSHEFSFYCKFFLYDSNVCGWRDLGWIKYQNFVNP